MFYATYRPTRPAQQPAQPHDNAECETNLGSYSFLTRIPESNITFLAQGRIAGQRNTSDLTVLADHSIRALVNRICRRGVPGHDPDLITWSIRVSVSRTGAITRRLAALREEPVRGPGGRA